MTELWIIEGSGKKESLGKSLAKLDRTAKVFATLGHIMKYPDDLSEIGIASDLSEPLRVPKEAEMVEYMIGLAAESTHIYIATDADQEGDVIAWDVHEIFRGAGVKLPIERVPLRGIDPESVKMALSVSYEVTAEDAAPGRARAMIDRMLGATFSSSAAPVGRITSGILGRLSKKAVPLRKYIVVVPAEDGGMPFRTDVVPFNRHQDGVLREVVSAKLASVPAAEQIYYQYPAENMGDLAVSISDQARSCGQKKPVREIADSMQRLYEAGSLSYPRSSARGYGPSAMTRIRKSMTDIPGGASRNLGVEIREDRRTHDAPHPIGPVNLSGSQHGFISDNSVRVAVAQSVARASHLWPAETPDKQALQSVLMGAGISYDDAQWLSGLTWTRWDGVIPPGAEAWVNSEFINRSVDAALVLLQMEEEVGKPSTWIHRADKMANQKNQLVQPTEDGMALVLTDLGHRALAAAPEFMRTPEFSRSIERMCNDGKGSGPTPWREIVSDIIAAQPAEIRDAIMSRLPAPEYAPRERMMVAFPEPTMAPRPPDTDY